MDGISASEDVVLTRCHLLALRSPLLNFLPHPHHALSFLPHPHHALSFLPHPHHALNFLPGAVDGFDTSSGCPNVANHSVAVRRALLALRRRLPAAALRAIPHNMRSCNDSLACQMRLKRRSAADMRRSRYCAVAAGDTPTTGRLYDAIACGCVPILLTDDVQLPFPATAPLPLDGYGFRLAEADFMADPLAAVRRIVDQPAHVWQHAQRRVMLARRRLSYRSKTSLVATLALREAWATCLKQNVSHARHPSSVAKC